jgi:DNA-binding MarR family transcriptional regulator
MEMLKHKIFFVKRRSQKTKLPELGEKNLFFNFLITEELKYLAYLFYCEKPRVEKKYKIIFPTELILDLEDVSPVKREQIKQVYLMICFQVKYNGYCTLTDNKMQEKLQFEPKRAIRWLEAKGYITKNIIGHRKWEYTSVNANHPREKWTKVRKLFLSKKYKNRQNGYKAENQLKSYLFRIVKTLLLLKKEKRIKKKKEKNLKRNGIECESLEKQRQQLKDDIRESIATNKFPRSKLWFLARMTFKKKERILLPYPTLKHLVLDLLECRSSRRKTILATYSEILKHTENQEKCLLKDFELSKIIGVTETTINTTLHWLEKKGYIDRKKKSRNDSSLRYREIKLTNRYKIARKKNLEYNNYSLIFDNLNIYSIYKIYYGIFFEDPPNCHGGQTTEFEEY